MSGLRIVLADSSDIQRNGIKNILISNGNMVYEAKDGGTALRLSRSLKPDLVIVDINLLNLNGYEVGRILDETEEFPVILMTSTLQRDFYEEIKKYTVFSYIIKPVDKSVLLNTIEITVENFKKIKKLKEQVEKLKKQIESRKKIEKAKGLIMKDKGLSEDDAYKVMRKMSMDMTLPMDIIAEMIIDKYKK
ncbi:MAG: ANTAR domain-containing response regulator [Minisyncoccia bacterium]